MVPTQETWLTLAACLSAVASLVWVAVGGIDGSMAASMDAGNHGEWAALAWVFAVLIAIVFPLLLALLALVHVVFLVLLKSR